MTTDTDKTSTENAVLNAETDEAIQKPEPASRAMGARSAEPTEFYGLLKAVVTDPSLTPEQKKSLIDELRKSSPTSDTWTFRWAIWILGLVVLLTIISLWSLSAGQSQIPDGLVAIGSAAAGGLAGLLTPGRGLEN